MKNRSANQSPAVLGCPDWCEHVEVGHPYDDISGTGYPMRHHEVILIDSEDLTLELTQPEVMTPTGAELIDDIRIGIAGDTGGLELTGERVALFAQKIRSAADVLTAKAGR